MQIRVPTVLVSNDPPQRHFRFSPRRESAEDAFFNSEIRMVVDTGRRIERGHKTDSYVNAIQGTNIPSALPKEDAVQREELLIQENSRDGILTRDDLEHYRTSSKWKFIRRCLCLFFCLIWLLLLFLALFMIFSTPKCIPVADKWWQGAIIYEIWTPSFQDSDGDGIGDLNGIQSRLSDLKSIGINAVFPRPFILTEASGEGAMDYKNVAYSVGGLNQAKQLIDEIHAKDLKIVIDIPIVATSDQHEWFQKSAKASLPENAGFANFYYWKRNVEPSAFVDRYKNSSVLYFHLKDRPDLPILNWKSENVSRSVKQAISFWIDQGVDGFHLGAVEHLARSLDAQNPDWPEISRILKQIRDHVDTYSNESVVAKGKEIFLIASPEPIKEEQKRMLQTEAGLDAVVNTELLKIAQSNKICYESENNVANCFNEILADLLIFHTLDGVHPVWELGNALTSRVATRIRSRIHAELMTMIQMMLPGTSFVYYGEEIGIRDSEWSHNPQRGIMQWNNSVNAGFSSSANLESPVATDFSNINFDRQIGDSHSPLQTFKKLAKLRKDHPFLVTAQTYISKTFNNAFSICRFDQTPNSACNKVFVAVVNFGKRETVHSLNDLPPLSQTKNRQGEIIATNSVAKNWQTGQSIDFSDGQIKLGPEEGLKCSFNKDNYINTSYKSFIKPQPDILIKMI
uniref:Alpha-glucosidase n=1 Tax=Panagrolaimus sp. JU765 TaxID=591449 RepID=A0AC34QGQ1_9BILA